MSSSEVYAKFWSELVIRARERLLLELSRLSDVEQSTDQRSLLELLLTVHERMGKSKSCYNNYLKTDYCGHRYLYNIYIQKHIFACACIGKAGTRPMESEITYIRHKFGTLNEKDSSWWQEIQDLMITAMIERLREVSVLELSIDE